jgi:hypothetical protein
MLLCEISNFSSEADKNCPLLCYFVTGTGNFVPKELQQIAKKQPTTAKVSILSGLVF